MSLINDMLNDLEKSGDKKKKTAKKSEAIEKEEKKIVKKTVKNTVKKTSKKISKKKDEVLVNKTEEVADVSNEVSENSSLDSEDNSIEEIEVPIADSKDDNNNESDLAVVQSLEKNNVSKEPIETKKEIKYKESVEPAITLKEDNSSDFLAELDNMIADGEKFEDSSSVNSNKVPKLENKDLSSNLDNVVNNVSASKENNISKDIVSPKVDNAIDMDNAASDPLSESDKIIGDEIEDSIKKHFDGSGKENKLKSWVHENLDKVNFPKVNFGKKIVISKNLKIVLIICSATLFAIIGHKMYGRLFSISSIEMGSTSINNSVEEDIVETTNDFIHQEVEKLKSIAKDPNILEKEVEFTEESAEKIEFGEPQSIAEEDAWKLFYEEHKKLVSEGKFHEAELELLREMVIDDDNLELKELLIKLYLKQGRAVEARKLLQQGLKINPKHSGLIRLKINMFVMNKKYAEALEYLGESAMPSMTEDPEYYALIADLNKYTGEYKKAIDIYQELLSHYQDHARWWLGIALCYENVEDYNLALYSYRQSVKRGSLSYKLSRFSEDRIKLLSQYFDG